jgi:hypothetical protein
MSTERPTQRLWQRPLLRYTKYGFLTWRSWVHMLAFAVGEFMLIGGIRYWTPILWP